MRIAQTHGAWGHGMLATVAIARLAPQIDTYPAGSTGWTSERERMGTSIIGVTVVSEAASLPLGAGMANELDHAHLRQAVEICVTDGYAGQARELLAIPGTEQHMSPETLARISNSISPTHRR